MRNRISIVFMAVVVLAISLPSASAQTKSAKAAEIALPSEETVNGFMHFTFGYDPGTTWKILKIQPSRYGLAEVDVALAQKDQAPNYYQLFISPNGDYAVLGEVIPFGVKPNARARKVLDAGAKGPSKGPATAAITVVEFSDFECPHCKEAQPAIDKLLAAHPEIKFVFQNYPLPSHDWARKAAAYADCVAQSSNKDAFWKFVGDTFEAQTQITASNADEKLTAIADGAGVKGAEIAACAALPATDGRVQKSIDLGADADVNSTPTFFINGRKLGNITGIPDNVMTEILGFHTLEDK